LSQRALEQLRRLGVQVRLNAKVVRVDSQGVAVQAPDAPEIQNKSAYSPDETSAECYEIKSKTVIWAAGVAASPLGRVLQAATGCELDRAGRVRVQPDLSVAGAPEISVIGDLAAALSHHKGTTKPVPGVSPAAKQMGRTAAANILRRIRGQSTLAFRYRDYGNLATIGRNAAVVDLATPLGPLRFSGKLAWLFWLFAHVYFLIGFRNRFLVLIDWAHAYLSFSRSARVVVESARDTKPSA
jgi:NADH:ubiquinone reductase (H+-translocating)